MNKNRGANKNRKKTINHHHTKMTNAFSKINDEQIRIASETRAVWELQESQRCLATTTINKLLKKANSFAKGSTKSRTADASQSQKKAVVNQKTIKPAQQISIAEQNTNNSLPESTDELESLHEKRVNVASQPTSESRFAKHKANRTDHHRMAKHEQPITIAKAVQQFYPKGPANSNRRATNNVKRKANANRNLHKTNAE